ncbi:hypothetical protein ACLVL5_06255 [Streptococcus pneumoniae]
MKILDHEHPVNKEMKAHMKFFYSFREIDPANISPESYQKLYAFPNGYGASVVKGFVSFGHEELAVIFFENPVKFYRSKKKRFRKKLIKQLGQYHITYDTPITSDVNRYSDHKELQRDLDRISKLKGV